MSRFDRQHYGLVVRAVSLLVIAAWVSASSCTPTPPSDGATKPIPSTVRSDSFNRCALQPFWTVLDPVGGATVAGTGVGTNSAGLALSIPAGAPHDLSAGANNACRVVQDTPDSDLDLQVRVEPQFNAATQLVGLIVEQDDSHLLTCGVGYDGTALVLSAQTFDSGGVVARGNGSIPSSTQVWLALHRAGSDWTLQYSTDGQSFTTFAAFTWDVVISRVGLFAANSSADTASGLSARFASFESSNDPLPAAETLPSGVTLTTSVTGQGTVETSPTQPTYYCGETVTLTAKPADGWLFIEWTGDLSGANPQETLSMTGSHSVGAVFASRTIPVISNVKITPTPDGAVVTWRTDLPSDSRVACGTTTAYELPPVSDPTLVTEHALTLVGLVFGRLYHLQIASIDSDGDEGKSGDHTLTPGDMSGIQSDDFNACTLDAPWTVTDPRGDATVSLTGIATPDALLRIALPAGASHDITGGVDSSVRVLQPAANADLEIQTKLQSQFGAGTQSQGLVVQQDAATFLRFYATYDGSAFKLRSTTYAGLADATDRGTQTIGKISPLWLSAKRAANNWTLRYSTDGLTWLDHQAFPWTATVAQVGLFAANSSTGPAPAFTASFDYFANAFEPLTAEDTTPSSPAATLTTHVSGNGSITVSPNRSLYYCGEPVQLTATPDVGWFFGSWSGDVTGTNPQQNLPMSATRSVTATFTPDTRPLQISAVSVNATTTAASFNWSTNKDATSQVLYGRTPSYELGSPSDAQYGLSHGINVSGLSPATVYHYSIRSVDGLGNVLSTPDATFNTGITGAFVSDDFNAFNLNPALWTIRDPLADATFALTGTNTQNARLQITVPAGTAHDISSAGTINAPYVVQTVNDTDFAVSAKFDSTFTQSTQAQGVLIQQGAGTLIRVDFYGGNGTASLFVATISNGVSTTLYNAPITVGAPYFERITRTGNAWKIEYSHDGAAWTTAATFQFAMKVNAIGAWAGNQGSSPPAFTAALDYFFNESSPIAPEDGAQVTDTFPPNLINPNALPNRTSVTVSWSVDEPATSHVDYGLTTAYELGSASGSTLVNRDSVTLGPLQEQTTYHFRIVATDAAGNWAQSPDLTAKTTTASAGPNIDVWYGAVQEFGKIGTPQPFDNILGNVSDPSGVTSLSYTLNGGPAKALSMGPDTRRIASAGDFNVDLPVASLLAGVNHVRITAVNGNGQSTVSDVQVINSAGPIWPLPYSIDWASVANISDVAQVVDGLWHLDGATVRPTILAYDRLIAIGDATWDDYEVLVPITPYSLDPAGYAAPSYGPGVGVLLRWPGHTNDGHQPWEGVYPLGALGMYRWTTSANQWQMFGNNGVLLQTVTEPITFGVTLMYRMRVQTDSVTGASTYKLRVWPANTAEPTTWKVTGTQSSSVDPGHGCLLLLAHHVDATFGPVTITPGPFAN
jgi:regulation of enolase protein 1 (concanavalin A-like superfamily)